MQQSPPIHFPACVNTAGAKGITPPIRCHSNDCIEALSPPLVPIKDKSMAEILIH